MMQISEVVITHIFQTVQVPGTCTAEGEARFHTYYSNYGQPLFASLKYLRHHHHV